MWGNQMKWGRYGIAVFAVLTMVMATSTPAFAAAPPNGAGSVGDCKVTGSIQFKPALVNGGTQTTTIKIKLKSVKGTPCTLGTLDGANVATVQVAGSGTVSANDCALFFPGTTGGSFPVSLPVTAKWKMNKGATPKKIANSLGGVPALFTAATPPVLPNVLHYGVSFGSGSIVGSGSFASHSIGFLGLEDQASTDLGPACAAKGVKKVTFGVKANPADGVKGFADFGVA